MSDLPHISSPQNQRVKDAIKLRERRGRQKQHRFLIDGFRELRQALLAGLKPTEVFVFPPLANSQLAAQLIGQLIQQGAAVSQVSAPVWEKLAFGHRQEGIVAIATREVETAATLEVPRDGIVIVLDRVEKPGNIGAVLRTADATGVSAVALSDPQTDLYNPNAIRASLGAVFAVPVHVDTAANLRDRLLATETHIYVTRVDATTEYFDVDLAGRCAVVLGSEAHGVSPCWLTTKLTGIRIPMKGAVDSLNVSTAAAAVLYEAVRQRRS